jgi:hypothetical protein
MRLNERCGLSLKLYEGDKAGGSGRGKFRLQVTGQYSAVDTFITREALLQVRAEIDAALNERHEDGSIPEGQTEQASTTQWQKFDPMNPPEQGSTHLALNVYGMIIHGHYNYSEKAWIDQKGHRFDCVTHFSKIKLPEPEGPNRASLNTFSAQCLPFRNDD